MHCVLVQTQLTRASLTIPGVKEAAVQAGLTAWVEGRGTQPPTWGTLLAAMETAGVGQMHILDLKKKLGLS